MAFTISTITAFVTRDKNDNDDEGVIGFRAADGSWMPLVCADEARVKSMLPVAEDFSRLHGIDYRILQFTVREDVTDKIKELFLHNKTT